MKHPCSTVKSTVLIIGLLVCSASYAANCVIAVKDTQAEFYDPAVQPTSSDQTPGQNLDVALGIKSVAKTETIQIPKGQVYGSPGADPSGQFMQLYSQRKLYRAPSDAVKNIKLKGCFAQPICLIAHSDTIGMKNLSDPSSNLSNVRRGDRLSAVATKGSSEADRSFLVSIHSQYYWVPAKDVAVYVNKTCEQLINVPTPEPPAAVVAAAAVKQAQTSRYAFGFEAGYGVGYSADGYSPFITDVPDPSNVGSLSNPIVTEVKKGTAFFLGPLLEVKFSESFKLKFAAQYQENTYKYIGKDNPTIASNSLDSLPDIGGTLKNQSVVFGVAPAWEIGWPQHRFGIGIDLRSHYYISKPSTITYRVGTVFKANELQVEAGPKGFELTTLLSLYYQWYVSDSSPFAVRLTAESDAKQINAGLAIFY